MSNEQKPVNVMHAIVLNEDTYDLLSVAAAENNISRAELVRQALEEWVWERREE